MKPQWHKVTSHELSHNGTKKQVMKIGNKNNHIELKPRKHFSCALVSLWPSSMFLCLDVLVAKPKSI